MVLTGQLAELPIGLDDQLGIYREDLLIQRARRRRSSASRFMTFSALTRYADLLMGTRLLAPDSLAWLRARSSAIVPVDFIPEG